MTLLLTAIIALGIFLVGQSYYGFGACAFIVAAFMLWWEGQPARPVDLDF
jgi:hypothetical protein